MQNQLLLPIALICILVASTLVTTRSQAAPLSAAKDIQFTAAIDDSPQLYAERLPQNFEADKEYHVLIALHGHGSDRRQGISDRPEFQAAQAAAAEYEMIYVSPDYRANASWMGPKAEADVVQIIADLRKKYRVGKIFLTGASMGGSSSLTFTALHPDLIAGVCSQNGTANHLEYQGFQDAISASFGGTKAQIPLEYKKRSAEYWPEAFTMPVAIAAGGEDTTVPPASVVRLAAILKQLNRPVSLNYQPDGGHSTSYENTMAGLQFVIRTALGLEAK